MMGPNPFLDLVEMFEQYINAVDAPCQVLPDHEADCSCATHLRVRQLRAEALDLIQRVKKSRPHRRGPKAGWR